MQSKPLLDKLQDLRPQMVVALGELVRRESPSTHKPLLDALAGDLAGRFAALGAEVTRLEGHTHGDHVRAVFPAGGGAQPEDGKPGPGLLLCHYDTVWSPGTLGKMPFRVEASRAYGPGAFDMKASIVMAEFAIHALRALDLPLPRPLVVLLTSDEEIGSPSSRAVIEAHAREAAYVLVMEPPSHNGAFKTARKGIGRFTLEITGRASHAGTQPDQGVSANHELAHQILNLQRLQDPAAGTTINVGVVRGGTRRNVVPARAEAELDVRAWTLEEAERIQQAVMDLQPVTPGAQIEVRGGFVRPPMARTPAVAELYRRARAIAAGLGLDLGEVSTGGGSDANFTAALGLPTLDGLGAVGDGAHADHEHVRVDFLPIRTALLAALLHRL